MSISVGSNVALSSSIIPLIIKYDPDIVDDFKTASWLGKFNIKFGSWVALEVVDF